MHATIMQLMRAQQTHAAVNDSIARNEAMLNTLKDVVRTTQDTIADLYEISNNCKRAEHDIRGDLDYQSTNRVVLKPAKSVSQHNMHTNKDHKIKTKHRRGPHEHADRGSDRISQSTYRRWKRSAAFDGEDM